MHDEWYKRNVLYLILVQIECGCNTVENNDKQSWILSGSDKIMYYVLLQQQNFPYKM